MNSPRIYVGTSGWMYPWNAGGTLDWYVEQSGLNSVELNASFYRFPYPNQVKSWARRGSRLRWSVKIHQSITHYRRLSKSSYRVWDRFKSLFQPLDEHIDYYLLQLPPTIRCTEKWLKRLEDFLDHAGLGHRMAVEYRSPDCYTEKIRKHAEKQGYTLVSIDSPMARWVTKTKDRVYLRLHGSSDWYAHDYSHEELEEIAKHIITQKPMMIHAYFNNNHWMLENARAFKNILEQKIRKKE